MDDKTARKLLEQAVTAFNHAVGEYESCGEQLNRRCIRQYGQALGLLDAVAMLNENLKGEAYLLESQWRHTNFVQHYRHTKIREVQQ